VDELDAFFLEHRRCGELDTGVEDGHPLFGGSCIVNPDGEIVAAARTDDDELVIADCDLDATRFNKETIFDFQRHRRIEHYGRITSQTGVTLPD